MEIVKSGESITMDSRQIAELTGKRHDHVMRDIEDQIGRLGGLPRFGDTYLNPQNGQKYPCYKLPYRETMILVSGYSVELRAKVVDKWMELEKSARLALPDFSDPAAAARAWANEYEGKVKAVKALEEAKPKVAFYDAVAEAKDTIDMGDVAKVLNIPGMGRNNLFAFLRGKKILMHDNQPYQEYVSRGYFRTIEASFTTANGAVHPVLKTVVFQKGLDFIRKTIEAGQE